MRATCLCLVALLAAPYVDAAPAPDTSKQKLETLKKKLLGVLNDWVNEDNAHWLTVPFSNSKPTCKPEVRVLRRVSPNRAKAVILFAAYGENGRLKNHDVVLTVYLTYQDGCWTTETFEASSLAVDTKQFHPTFAFLMMAIDEAAEK
jgi:hypothetical protein